jgi:hypothetical protein
MFQIQNLPNGLSSSRRNDSYSLLLLIRNFFKHLQPNLHSMESASTLNQSQAFQKTAADDALVSSADAIVNEPDLDSSLALEPEPLIAPVEPNAEIETRNPIELTENFHQELHREEKTSSVLAKRSLNGPPSRVSKPTRRVSSDVPLQARHSSGVENLASPGYMRPTFASLSKRRTPSQ